MDFDETAADYSGQVDEVVGFSGQRHEFFLDVKARLIERLIDLHFGRQTAVRLLEAGSGPGLLQRRMRRDRLQAWAFDLSLGCLAQARRAGAGRRQVAAAGLRAPFAGASFNLVLAVCVLHHVPVAQRQSFVGEMVRVTRPGGLCVIIEHNPWNPLTRRTVARCAFDRDAVLLSRPATERHFRSAGLSAIRSRYFLFLPLQSRGWQRVERGLAALPVGAQYLSLGVKA
jgi:SAM-dependent methyltransferase